MIVIPLIKRLIRIINIKGSRIVATTRSHGTGLIQQALEIIQADTVLRVGGAGHKVDKGVFRNLSLGGRGLNFSVRGGVLNIRWGLKIPWTHSSMGVLSPIAPPLNTPLKVLLLIMEYRRALRYKSNNWLKLWFWRF